MAKHRAFSFFFNFIAVEFPFKKKLRGLRESIDVRNIPTDKTTGQQFLTCARARLIVYVEQSIVNAITHQPDLGTDTTQRRAG
jgi:hypothetical protein